jgi:hypothetical protein
VTLFLEFNIWTGWWYKISVFFSPKLSSITILFVFFKK